MSALLVAGFAPAQVRRSRAAQTAERQAAVQDFFPLAVGNQWTYVLSDSRIEGDLTVEITESVELNGQVYYRLAGFSPRPSLVRMTAGGRLVALDEESGVESLWVDFAAPVGGQWTPEGRDECLGPAGVDDRHVRTATAVGTFSAVRVAYRQGPCADAGITEERYAPSVGLLTREEISIAGPRTYELSRAVVGGRSIDPRGLAFSLRIDSPVYLPGTDVAPAEAPVMRLWLTLENTSDQPLTLFFPSGQRFDVSIENERGETVYVWSANKLFPAVTGEIELSPGVETWQTQIPLQSLDSGRDLPAGNYTVEGRLTNSGGPRFAATAGFTIADVVF